MEVSYENYGSRQIKSFGTCCCGVVLVPLTMVLIFWNESNAVASYSTAQMVKSATVLPECIPSNANADKLIFTTCAVAAPKLDLPSTLSPFLNFSGVELDWHMEIFLNTQETHKECHKDDHGGQVCKTTYTCKQGWSSTWIDSGDFKCPQSPHSNVGYTFPSSLTSSGSIKAEEYGVVMSKYGGFSGGFALDATLMGQIPSINMGSSMHEYKYGWTDWYGRNGGVLSPTMLQYSGGYLTTFDHNPQLGDLRISLSGRAVNQATVAAKQGDAMALGGSGNSRLAPWPPQKVGYFGEKSKELEKLYPGKLSIDEFVTRWTSEISFETWLLRFIALVLLIVACEMIVQPLSVAADLLRVVNCCTCGLGSVLDGAAQCVLHTTAFVLALCLGFIAIAVAWIAARPELGVGLLVLVVALMGAWVFTHRKRSSARQFNGAAEGLMMSGAGGNFPVAQQAMPNRPSGQLQVVCPSGVGPGSTISVQGPTGALYQVVVPGDVRPGQVFSVEVPV